MSRKFGEQDAADQAQKYAGKINENNVSDLVDKEDKIKGLFEKAGALKKYWDDVCEVFSLIKDRFNGTYTDTPWPTIASLAGALLYVFSPIDCIPDFIPIAGFIDDASVFGFVIMAASADLMKYRSWKSQQKCLSSVPIAIEAKDIKEGTTLEAEVIEEAAAKEGANND